MIDEAFSSAVKGGGLEKVIFLSFTTCWFSATFSSILLHIFQFSVKMLIKLCSQVSSSYQQYSVQVGGNTTLQSLLVSGTAQFGIIYFQPDPETKFSDFGAKRLASERLFYAANHVNK